VGMRITDRFIHSLLFEFLYVPCVLCVLCASIPAAAAPKNLLTNPGFEGVDPKTNFPPAWETITIGAPADFAIDTTESHEGRQSVRITATEITRSYFASTSAIPVAPGERIR